MNSKKIGKVVTSKFVGTGPSSYKKRIYRAAVSQKLRNTVLENRLIPALTIFVLRSVRRSAFLTYQGASATFLSTLFWNLYYSSVTRFCESTYAKSPNRLQNLSVEHQLDETIR